MNMSTLSNIIIIDIDGTLIKGQSQMYFISFLRKKGMISFLKSLVILIWFALYKIKAVKNPSKILSFALACFRGREISTLRNYAENFIEDVLKYKYYPYSKELLSTLKKEGSRIILLSSAVEPIVTAIAKDLEITETISSRLAIEDGIFTGRLESQQVYAQNKISFLTEYLQKNKIGINSVTVIADHYSDQQLLEAAGKAFVANPDKGMLIWAQQRNIPVIYLNNNEFIQYLQSYTKSE